MKSWLTLTLLLLLSNLAVGSPTVYEADFESGASGWTGGVGWTITNPSDQTYWYSGNSSNADLHSYKPQFLLGSSWNLSTRLSFKQGYRSGNTLATASVAFSGSTSNPGPSVLVTFNRLSNGYLGIQVQWWNGTVWNTVADSGWLTTTQTDFTVVVQRMAAAPNQLYVAVSGTGWAGWSVWTQVIGNLNTIQIPGYHVYESNVWFTDLSIQTPAPIWSTNQRHYHDLASQGVSDLVSHYWTGDFKGGHIKPTLSGYPAPLLPDPQYRGQIWERAMMIYAIEGLYRMDADINLHELIKSQWTYDSSAITGFTEAEWEETIGVTSQALDDACWKLIYLIIAYQQTGNSLALEYAERLFQNIYSHWWDRSPGSAGGLWYDDPVDPVAHPTQTPQSKQLYAAAFVYAGYQLYQIDPAMYYTGLPYSALQYASSEQTWIQNHLSRSDGIFSCQWMLDGSHWIDPSTGATVVWNCSGQPINGGCPPPIAANDIHEAASASYFGGVTAMAAALALRNQITGDSTSLAQAAALSNAISTSMLSMGNVTTIGVPATKNVFVNDRDAWTDGAFASMWARNVLAVYSNNGQPLAGVSANVLDTLRNTADSIGQWGRLQNGTYYGDWNDWYTNPTNTTFEVGPGLPLWENKASPSKAAQIMTSATSVSLMVAAAYLP